MTRILRQTLTLSGRLPARFQSILFRQTQSFAFDHDRGHLQTEMMDLGATGYRVSRVISTGHTIGLYEDRNVTLLFPTAGRLSVRVAGQETVVRPGEAGQFLPHARETRTVPPPGGRYAGIVLMFPAAEMQAIARLAGIDAICGRDVMATKGAAALRIARYAGFVLAEAARADELPRTPHEVARIAAILRDLLADWLAEAVPPDVRGGTGRGGIDHVRVRRAEAILQARADEPIAIAELARELGFSLRSLQVAFQAVHGEGPKARLTRIRLDRARARLLAAEPDQQVTEIAFDCGFTHLSRFAEAYLQLYGERPSETLARRRRVRATHDGPPRRC